MVVLRDPRPVARAIDDPRVDVQAFVVTWWDGEPANIDPADDLRWVPAPGGKVGKGDGSGRVAARPTNRARLPGP